jgi:hypothetical protein
MYAIPAGNLAFPYHRHLKSASPQMSVQYMEIIEPLAKCPEIIGENRWESPIWRLRQFCSEFLAIGLQNQRVP